MRTTQTGESRWQRIAAPVAIACHRSIATHAAIQALLMIKIARSAFVPGAVAGLSNHNRVKAVGHPGERSAPVENSFILLRIISADYSQASLRH